MLFSFFPNVFTYSSPFLRVNAYSTGFSVSKLYIVPLGSYVSFVQQKVTGSAKFARARGSFVQVLKRRGSFVTARLPSGEIRRLSARCFSFFFPNHEFFLSLSTIKLVKFVIWVFVLMFVVVLKIL